ncbi:glycosyltransferase [uncultured Christiangramia sp.]|uniref:glycosyltransferase n=1 Tax=Christiangramia sp. 3-2217-3z TaxID=3417564 RepID=UPI002604DDF9|nr:glycosyltransferase [uncultured Christiangramia sp.]
MGKIKVLHIIKSLGRGGAEMLLPETLKLHDHGNFEFHYIYFLPWKNQMVSVIEDNHGTVMCYSAKNNIEMMLKVNNVIEYCKKEQINIIHSHLPWSGFLARSVFAKAGIPVIYTEHNIQERYHIATRLLNKFTFNSQNLALGVSKDVSDSIAKNIKPRIPVKTLLNGVNTEKFIKNADFGKKIKTEFNIPENATVIGNIAVFRKQKNLDLWIEAFSIIAKKYEVYGLLVGAGPEEQFLKQKIERLGLENRILLPGLQTDTIAYFSAMDIFMMSSNFEGLPIALLEAMSMECAIVATAAGGVREVVTKDSEGLLSKVNDAETLARNVSILIDDEIKLIDLQKNARLRVQNSFSLQTMVESLEVCYKEYAEV